MFVPVACSQCGKPFQVPEAEVGKPTVCPWCQATVPALPVGTPAAAPAASAPPGDSRPPARQEKPSQPEPLSLDDASADAPPAQVAPPRSKWFWWWAGGLGLITLVVVTGVTVAILRYKQGHTLGSEWRTFNPPNSSCSIE